MNTLISKLVAEMTRRFDLVESARMARIRNEATVQQLIGNVYLTRIRVAINGVEYAERMLPKGD